MSNEIGYFLEIAKDGKVKKSLMRLCVFLNTVLMGITVLWALAYGTITKTLTEMIPLIISAFAAGGLGEFLKERQKKHEQGE